MYHIQILEPRVLYRYEDSTQWADCDYKKPYLHKFIIKRETEKSYFIYRFLESEKRVPKTGKNIFAWDTEEKAIFNYLKRKQKHVSILRGKLKEIERNLEFAERRMAELTKYKEDNPTTSILQQLVSSKEKIR